MKSIDIEYNVLYADTDAMGIVYYANYLRFYEAGRRAFFREFSGNSGFGEDCIFPAVTVNLKYVKPAELDDKIIIRTSIKDIPTATIKFIQSIHHPEKGILNEAEIKLACVDPKNLKPKRCPAYLINLLN